MLPALSEGIELSSCLPELLGIDWSLVTQGHFVFVGTGAVNRPLARQLAWLGMKRCLLIDPKRYKPQSVISQCEPAEVGRFKAEVLAKELQGFGVQATALVKDVEVVPPGYLQSGSLMIVAVDNRRADICANRLAARMHCPIVKVNLEPSYLTASIRCYDLRENPPPVCLECQMSDRHYEQQQHPLSCDGNGTEQSTGSPRPLSQLAADAAALAIAQIVGSPDQWANRWWGKQWQQNLLGGQGGFSDLHPNPNCRWDHQQSWSQPSWISLSPDHTLGQLFQESELGLPENSTCEFSGRVATKFVCSECHESKTGFWWLTELDQPAAKCECGGKAYALPFYTYQRLGVAQLTELWERPLIDWGVTPGSVIRFHSESRQKTFCFSVNQL